MADLYQWMFQHNDIEIYIVASNSGVRSIYFHRQEFPMLKDLDGTGTHIQIIKQTVEQLKEYFDGRRKKFELVYDISGTEFQKKVWKELEKIPYGETRSYSDIAELVQNPKGVRAVGTANGKNPLSIVVPCHRVIAADGKLGGYSGGLDRKAWLLKLEQPK